MMFNTIFTVSLVLHVLLLLSVFDIYFRSPIIESLEPVPPSIEAPARRLALFVADGLRADYFFNKYGNTSLSPYLRDKIEQKGAWGVSHTQVPTESRPGHVALIGGFYEDPSAVFKGWKENPVDFDSVFNESFATFAFGSPDILPIFSRDSEKDNIHNYMYESELQDFSGESGQAGKLNYWVLNRFEKFLRVDMEDITLQTKVEEKGVVFFFHLLGTDVAGHANKPGSKEYAEAIISADDCTKQICSMIEDFFNDSNTAYVFTSDHGMTDWGSHGDGSTDETETPIVVWGAGVRGPILQQNYAPKDWDLSHLRRTDIKQADVAPLMSVLAGIPIPVNSIGELPHDFLIEDNEFILHSLNLNVLQLEKQYNTSMNNIKEKVFKHFYYPYDLDGETEFNMMFTLMTAKSTVEAIDAAKEIISFYLKGIAYYTEYFSYILKVIVTFIYIIWIFNMFMALLVSCYSNKDHPLYGFYTFNVFKSMDNRFNLLGLIVYLFFYMQRLEWSFYAYLLVIMYLLNCIYSYITLFLKLRLLLRDMPRSFNSFCRMISIGIGLTSLMCCLIYSFSVRYLLSVMMVIVALWPVVFHMNEFSSKKALLYQWFTCCFMVALFPTLPTIGYSTCCAYFGCACCSVGIFFSYTKYAFFRPDVDRYVVPLVYFVIFVLYCLALVDILMIEFSFTVNLGLSYLSRAISWFLLFGAFIGATLSNVSTSVTENFIVVCSFLFIPFLLLCSSHESFFPLFFVPLMLTWTDIECVIQENHEVRVQYAILTGTAEREESRIRMSSYLRISLFYLAFVILSYFGIGNLASLSSFDPIWTNRFVTVFSPFTMMGLIIMKSVIPMLMASCAMHVLQTKCEIPFEPLMISILIFSDIMGANFFLRVTNKGSWLTIGTSISHFVLTEVITLIILLMHWIVRFIMDPQYLNELKQYFRRVYEVGYHIHYD